MSLVCPHCSYADIGDETITESIVCAQCGYTFAVNASQDSEANTTSIEPFQTTGKFRLLETVGEGAYGVVWKGEDLELGRTVAVKLLHRGLISNKADAERFYREARAAAQLRHPGIVAVHEVAELNGVPAIISEFVDGSTLRQVIADGGLSFLETADVVAQVADALDYAHSLKIIHRDVKPGNIMVSVQTEEGARASRESRISLAGHGTAGTAPLSLAATESRARLLDFGLALREEVEATMTKDGQVLGTPSYMSPEQAMGDSHRVDRRSDVYSLGVVLYEMLTGEVPFKGASMVVLRKVIGDEPRRPRELQSSIPRDLETICLKAMSKSRDGRYKTAGEFAADLRRYLAGDPIAARPVGTLGTIWRFCRRNPATAASIVAITAILTISSIVSTSFAIKAIEARREVEHTLVESYVSNGIQAASSRRPAESLIWFAAAHDRAIDDPIAQQENAARFWSYARSAPIAQRAIAGVTDAKSMTVHPSGDLALVGNSQGAFFLLDFRRERLATFPNGQTTCVAVDWTTVGDRIVVGGAEGCTIFQLSSDLEFFSDPRPYQLPDLDSILTAAKFDPTGRYLAIADSEELRVWDCQEQRYSHKPVKLRSKATELSFSQNGKFLVAACEFEYCRVWSMSNEQDLELVYSPVETPGPEFALFNSPQKKPTFVVNDRYLVVSPDRFRLQLIDTDSWEVAQEVRYAEYERIIEWFCTNPERNVLAFGCDVRGLMVEIPSGRLIGNELAHDNTVTPGSFSSDGTTLLTACGDRTCRFWSVASSAQSKSPVFHQDSVYLAAFAADGRSFITIQQDGLARQWRDQSDHKQLPIGGRDSLLAMSPDGKHCIGAGVNIRRDLHEPQLHHLESFESIRSQPLDIAQAQLLNAAFSSDSQQVVLLTTMPPDTSGIESNLPNEEPQERPGLVHKLDITSGLPLQEAIVTPTEPIGASFSSDQKWLVVVCAGGPTLIIDNKQWLVKHRLFQEGLYNGNFLLRDYVRFFPDGTRFITWGIGFKARVWNAATGLQEYEIDGGELWYSDIQFSNSGKMFVATSYNKSATIHDALNGQQLCPPLVHPDWASTARFSPDDKFLLTACRDGKGRLWDWQSGQLAGSTMAHQDEVFDVCFAREGELMLTACRDGSARIWNTGSCKPMSPLLRTQGYCYRARTTPDDKLVILASQANALKVYSLPQLIEPETQPGMELMKRAEILSGARLDANGGIENLNTSEWLDRWKSR